ncbi:MAG: 2-oxo acid dehydrogenase subunit E2 [Solirubrobacterales bacterium]|nr:2-oxo acid dehydrogenase subunit E2 [Solirubrobacterales bacterium]
MAEVVMPRLSDSMEEGTIVRWLKRTGESVSAGEDLVEIETDKATVTYESELSGMLTVVAADGETLTVGTVIGRIDASPFAAGDGARSASRPDASPPRRAKASPVARRLAEERGLEVGDVQGTGPSGRISKRDVEAAARARPAVLSEPRAPSPTRPPRPTSRPLSPKGDVDIREPTRIQSTIARRMAEAKATIPDFTLSTEVDMDAIVRLREDQVDSGPVQIPTLNDFVVRACALALRRHPRVNASYREGRFELYERVNVGVAVATEDALLVPTVFDADTKSLGQIALETRALAERARAGKLAPSELAGGTFTISNLGMYGITEFVAVINPPQAAILAVGSLEDRAVLRDGAMKSSSRMKLTLTCDHRILYGADAAAFLQDVRTNLERPLRLAL